MNIGDYFNPSGFDVLATIQTDVGALHLLGNDTTQLLLVSQEDESMSDGETTGNVRLHAVFDYRGRHPLPVQVMALTRMVDLFVEQSPSLLTLRSSK